MYVHVDSSKAIGPNGNSYIVNLSTPLRNVTQVDLVSVNVPNTLFNYTTGNIVYNSIQYSLPPGFYTPDDLAKTVKIVTGLGVSYITSENMYVLSSPSQFTVSVTGDLVVLLGNIYGTSTTSVGTAYPYGTQILKSTQMALDNTVRTLFLDVTELRTNDVVDSTIAGNTVARTFAAVPLDVSHGSTKTFKETTDYSWSVTFDTPIPTISRFTVNWTDSSGKIVSFNGSEQNSFVLRVHCKSRAPDPPEPEPIEELVSRKITRAIQDAIPPPKPKNYKKYWVSIAVLIILGFVLYRVTRPSTPQTSSYTNRT